MRGAEAGDEVAAANAAALFEGLEHVVDGAESAGNIFGGDGFASENAVAVEKLQREGVAGFGGGWAQRRIDAWSPTLSTVELERMVLPRRRPTLGREAFPKSRHEFGAPRWCLSGRFRRVLRAGSSDQRPCALGGVVRRERKTIAGLQAARSARAFGPRDVGAQSVQRIVGDEAAPDQAPERIDGFAGIAAADGLMQRIEEAGAGGFEDGKKLLFALGERLGERPLLRQQRQLVGEIKSDAAIAFADGLDAGPCHFARGDQRVEAGRIVAGNARGQDGRFKQRCGNGRALQALDGIEQRIEMCGTAAARREQALPVREEAGQRVLLDWLDFAAQLGERLAANLAQDFRIAPFAMKPAGTESAFEDAALWASRRSAFSTTAVSRRKTIGGLRAG